MDKTDNKLFYRKLRNLSLPIIFQSLMIPWVMLRFRKYKWVQNLTRDPLENTEDA